MPYFGSSHINPKSPYLGHIFAEQKFGEGYLRIQDRNRSHYRIPLALAPRKSVGGKSYTPPHLRRWRLGIYQRQDKEITYQYQGRDPVTGKFSTRGQKIIRHKYYRPPDPTSELQLARQQVFADAVLAAQNLTEEQKMYYTAIAKLRKAQTWFSVFVSKYLKTH